jgi:hypothetical protein
MIKAKLAFQGNGAQSLGQSIKPDNLSDMIMKADDEQLVFDLSFEKIGTLLATLDDLLMNLKIAEETLVFVEER